MRVALRWRSRADILGHDKARTTVMCESAETATGLASIRGTRIRAIDLNLPREWHTLRASAHRLKAERTHPEPCRV